MNARDTLMYQEAHESADVVARQFAANEAVVAALAQSLRAQPPRFIVTCARGSSDHAATYREVPVRDAARHRDRVGVAVGDFGLRGRAAVRGALFIAISQSGKKPGPAAQCAKRRSRPARAWWRW